MASSFHTLSGAEDAISHAMLVHHGAIMGWAKNAPGLTKLVLEAPIGSVIGHRVAASTGTLSQVSRVRIVLKLESYNNMPYYVLTAYPI